MDNIITIDWQLMQDNLIRVGLAFLLAAPLGWERKKWRTGAGLRTFPVVAMAACGYALIAKTMPDASAEVQSRLLQGLLAGIGFIGGGAVLKSNGNIRGLVTAASIWNTGAIGAAVAYEREEIAIVLAAINFFTLIFLAPVVSHDRENGNNNDR